MKAVPPTGVILAGMHSSSGKTAVTCMLLAALAKRELPIQPFKVGPDFIDPAFHSRFAGVPSRNLDAWMMGERGIVNEVGKADKFTLIFDRSQILFADQGIDITNKVIETFNSRARK